jgi:putative acetyltransferase
MQVRKFKSGEELELWQLFHDTIHQVNKSDYTTEQTMAWSPDTPDMERWCTRIHDISPFVVEYEGILLGYADIQPNGYIDHFYVHHQWQRRGVGSLLMRKILEVAKENNISKLFSNVSITARPFFESWGFEVEQEQLVQIRGSILKNFNMVRTLPDSSVKVR